MNWRPLALAACACFDVHVTAIAQPAPHALHTASFGGQFGVAASDTLHVEAIWIEQRRLRLLISSPSGDQLPLERLREVSGSVTAAGRESPLVLMEVVGHFEARIPSLTKPAIIAVRLKTSDRSDDQLTFTFADHSENRLGVYWPTPPEIPDTLQGLLRALTFDRQALLAVKDQEEYLGLSEIEERIRERSLALESYLAPLPAEAQQAARSTITAIVRACWLLHTSLDYGSLIQSDAARTEIVEKLGTIPGLMAGLAK